jgi:hypothetical protein
MSPHSEIKRGYWFYDTVRKKPVQAKEDGEEELKYGWYEPLPITKEMLLRVGFKESKQPGMTVYEKNGFFLYRRQTSEHYQLMQFGELREILTYMHQVQKKYREDVPENLQ